MAALRLITARAATETTSAALQICGAYGLTRELPLERLYRQAKFYEVAQGSSSCNGWSPARPSSPASPRRASNTGRTPDERMTSAETAAPLLRYASSGGVATLTLDRPAARNALNSALVAQFDAALTRAEQDPEVAAIVITGSDPVFCAGLDIREFNATGRPRPASTTSSCACPHWRSPPSAP